MKPRLEAGQAEGVHMLLVQEKNFFFFGGWVEEGKFWDVGHVKVGECVTATRKGFGRSVVLIVQVVPESV